MEALPPILTDIFAETEAHAGIENLFAKLKECGTTMQKVARC
jgi:hypothetical protein